MASIVNQNFLYVETIHLNYRKILILY